MSCHLIVRRNKKVWPTQRKETDQIMRVNFEMDIYLSLPEVGHVLRGISSLSNFCWNAQYSSLHGANFVKITWPAPVVSLWPSTGISSLHSAASKIIHCECYLKLEYTLCKHYYVTVWSWLSSEMQVWSSSMCMNLTSALATGPGVMADKSCRIRWELCEKQVFAYWSWWFSICNDRGAVMDSRGQLRLWFSLIEQQLQWVCDADLWLHPRLRVRA